MFSIGRIDIEDAQDAAVIARKARKSTGAHIPELHTPAEDLEFYTQAILESEGSVCEIDGRVIGFILWNEDWINHLYVLPEFHRQGIGTALLQAALDSMQSEVVQLWTFQANTAAIAFYETRGFAIVESTDGSRNEESMPDHRLVLVLE
jgi:ribosomal protein S18 acetylase RimI-like enzyme